MKRVTVENSSIAGKGVFAAKNFKRGEFIGYIKGPIKYARNSSKRASLAFPDWVGFKPGRWIDPQPPFKYTNHSCNPSCGIKGTKTVTAMRSIKKGEEITIDYATTECDTEWDFKEQVGTNCRCGAKNCRKIIRSIQFLPEKVYKKYLPFIPSALQKEYLRTHKYKSIE